MVVNQPESRLSNGASGRDEAIASSLNLAVVFWRRRWIILICVLLSLAVAFVQLRRSVPMYQSSSLLYVHQYTPRIMGNESESSVAANLFTQCELIKSTANISTALAMPGVAESKLLRGSENPVGLLKSLVTAEPGKQGELLTVSMLSPEPTEAPLVLNSIVQAYIDYENSQQKSSALEVLKVLDNEKHRYEGLLQQISDAMVEFKQKNPEMALATDKGNIVTEKFATLSSELTAAELQTLDLQIQNDEIAAVKNDPVQLWQYILTLQGQGKATLPQQASEAQAELNGLLAQEGEVAEEGGPNLPKLQELHHRIDTLRQKINGEQQQTMDNFVSVAALNLKQAKFREDDLAKKVAEERNAAVKLNSQSAKFDQMTAESRRDERMLDTLDNRIKELEVTEGAGGAGGLTVSILETAKPNFVPVSPKPAQTMAIGLIVGIMMGLSGALLQDFLDQRLRSSDEISQLLDLPLLGTIPHMNGKFTAPQRGQEVHLRTRSDVSEAYRTVRTAIYFGVPEDSGKTIVVTSPAPGDGKSTIASNISIAMAQAGRKVLLIDADCRRPTQHKSFSVEAEVGLSTVLLGRSPLPAALHSTSVQNLDILPCGPLPTNPAELLDSQAFIDLLKVLRPKYDKIIIDSPPVVPVTDSRIIAASCDVTILVLRAEKSTRKMAQYACDCLSAVGANVLGVVVNDVPRGQNGSYYYHGYGYGGYRYGYSSNGTTHNGNGASKEVKAITVASKSLDS